MSNNDLPTEWSTKISINGIDITDLFLTGDSKSGLDSQTMSVTSSLRATLNGNSPRMRTLDLRGRITLSLINSEREVRQFTGYVVAATSKGAEYTLECKDNFRILEEMQTGGGFGTGVLPIEMLYYLIANAMPESINRDSFPASAGKALGDYTWLFQQRKFIFVAPLPACSLTHSNVNLAGASLYKTDQASFVDDFNIADMLPQQTPTEWKPGGTRIRIEVEAEGMLEAFEKGRERLRRLLDYLSFGLNFSTPGYGWQTQSQLFRYDRNRILTDVRETAWAYIGDTLRSDRYWLQWTPPHLTGDGFTIKTDDSLFDLYHILQPLLEREDEELNSAQRSIMNACHALRQVRQAENVRDALDHIFRCMEYLLKGYKVQPMFSDQDTSALLKAAREYQAERDKEAPDAERVMRDRRLVSLLKSINQVPLRTTWYHFCSQHSLDFPEPDQEFLWRLRSERNENQHGRMARVKRDDIHRAASMMEKAIVAAATRTS